MATLAEQLTALTADEASDLMGQLTTATRERLVEAVAAAVSRENLDHIVERVREEIAAEGVDNVAWVVFTAQEWDDGFYLHDCGALYCTDGTSPTAEFSQELEFDVRDQLTAEFGRVGRSFAYAVNPVTAATYSDDYAGQVYDHIGVVDGYIP